MLIAKRWYAVVMLFCGFWSNALAALVTVPPGLNPGEQYRLAFVTSNTRDALSTDIDVYNNFVTARQYDADAAHAKAVLKNLEKYYPGYQGQGYEVVGFVWWQGHKDQSAALASRYEQNLVHLINTLRKEFDAPKAMFVLATGCGKPTPIESQKGTFYFVSCLGLPLGRSEDSRPSIADCHEILDKHARVLAIFCRPGIISVAWFIESL